MKRMETEFRVPPFVYGKKVKRRKQKKKSLFLRVEYTASSPLNPIFPPITGIPVQGRGTLLKDSLSLMLLKNKKRKRNLFVCIYPKSNNNNNNNNDGYSRPQAVTS